MTKTYWTVVYRPRGSKCWTLSPMAFARRYRKRGGYGWFAKRETAQLACDESMKTYETIECRTAKVEVEE